MRISGGSRLTAFLFAVIAYCSTGLALADQFFVSTSGRDSNDGRSSSQAWRTIGKANAELRGGDSVTISAGAYEEAIEPARSGSGAGSRITYRAAVPGTVTISGGLRLADRSYVTVDGVDIAAEFYYANLRNSSHITIQNSVMWGVDYNPGIDMTSASYAILRNNHISGTNERYLDLIFLAGAAHHNLLENNYLDQASHALLILRGDSNYDNTDPRYNIFRGNTYVNDLHHCVNVMEGSHHNVFERESYLRCGTGHYEPKMQLPNYTAFIEGEAWHAWQPFGIYRFNLVMKSGSYALDEVHHAAFGGVSTRFEDGEIERVVGNRVYHNTLVDNYGLVFRLGAHCRNGCADVDYGDNQFKNNLFFGNASGNTGFGPTLIQYDFFGTSGPDEGGDVWSGNFVGGPNEDVVMWKGQGYTLDEATGLSSSEVAFSSNSYGTAGFENVNSLNFNLTSGSDAVDAGVPLTHTTSAGSGRTVEVLDAAFFIDGFGIVDGDTIQVGNEVVRVTSVSYSQNRLEVDRTISWQANTPVSFPHTGGSPDAGAHEFDLRRPKPPVLILSNLTE